MAKHGVVESGTTDDPRFAWLIHGSKAQAAYMAKHGHGLPWKHTYKVLEVRPHAVRLDVPTDGSVPRVNSWQLRRRVAPAPANEHSPDDTSPIITESGLLMPTNAATGPSVVVDGDAYAGDENEYSIERISHAERIGRYCKIWIRWQGADELTWRWRHELIRETSNEEILRELDAAVASERERTRTRKDTYAEEEPEDDETDGPSLEPTSSDELLGRGAPRVRNPPTRFVFAISEDDYAMAISRAYDHTLRRLAAVVYSLDDLHDYTYAEDSD